MIKKQKVSFTTPLKNFVFIEEKNVNTEVKRETVTSSFFPNIPASPAATCISSWLYVISDFFWAFIHTHTHICVYDARMFGFFLLLHQLDQDDHTTPQLSPITVYLEHFFHDHIYEACIYAVALFFSNFCRYCPCGCDAVDSTTAFPLTLSLRVPAAKSDSGEPGVSGKWRHDTVPETLSTSRMQQPLPAPLSR